jgi:hypothetical protein
MATFNGTVVLRLKDIHADNEVELAQAIAWLNPIIAKQVLSFDEKYEESDTTVTGNVTGADQRGVSGSVTITTKGNNGSISGTLSGKSDGTVTGGSVQATYNF